MGYGPYTGRKYLLDRNLWLWGPVVPVNKDDVYGAGERPVGDFEVMMEWAGGNIKFLQKFWKFQMNPRDTDIRDRALQAQWELTKAKTVLCLCSWSSVPLDIYQPSSPPSGCYQMWPSPRQRQMGPKSYPGTRLWLMPCSITKLHLDTQEEAEVTLHWVLRATPWGLDPWPISM